MSGPTMAAYQGTHLGATATVSSALPAGYTDTAGDDALLVIFARPGTVGIAAAAGWTALGPVQNTAGAFPISGVLLRRPLDGSGTVPADVVLSGTPTGVIAIRAVVHGANLVTPLDAGYPDGATSASDGATLGGGYTITNAPALALQLWGAANDSSANSTYSSLIPAATHTLVGFVPSPAAAGLFAITAQETLAAAGFYGRSVGINEPSSAVRFGAVYRFAPSTIPVTITGVTASASASADPGQPGIQANIGGATASATASATAGNVTARVAIVGATAAVAASADPGSPSLRVSVAGATAAAQASAQAGLVRAAATLAGATAAVAASAQGGLAQGAALIAGATAAVSAAASGGFVIVVTVTITITGASVAPSPWRGYAPAAGWAGAAAEPATRTRVVVPQWEGSANAGH